jgi:AcrR family transcriptional regulator
MQVKTSSKSVATPGRPPAGAGRVARELLLNSATELFATDGVAATTFAMIAKRAGFTPAMVHYYFKDRNQLCDAVVDERLLRIVSQVWDPVQPDADAPETIRGVVERLLGCIKTMPWIPSLWIREILNEGGLLRQKVIPRVPFKGAQSLAGAIARGQADGSLNADVEPLLVVSSTLGMVMLNIAAAGIWAQALHRKPLSTQKVQRHVTALLLDGVCRKRPSRPNAVSRTKNR